MDIKKQLIDANNHFKRLLEKDKVLRERNKDLVINGQHPYVLVITCSDSRVVPEILFNKTLGELFVIRTAGNVINEGELATIEYAIEHLKVQQVMVLGHTHCGAVHAAMKNEKGQYLDPILSRIRLVIKDNCDETLVSKLNAQEQVRYIKEKFPSYKGDVLAGLYDIETATFTYLG